MSNAKVQLVPAPGTPPPGQVPPGQTAPAEARPFGLDTTRVSVGVGGSIDSIRQEVDDAFKDMATFHNREPDEVMRMCAGHSARLSEIRVRIQRVEDIDRPWRNVRLREVEPALEQLSNQFQIASRLLSARELDWRMETGQQR